MEHLDYPSKASWESRQAWFESHIFKYEEVGSYLVGEQACALLAEVQSCFCAGAWAAVVIVAFAVIEANLQETSGETKYKKAADLLKSNGFDGRFDTLRKRRNALVHASSETPAITVDIQWDSRPVLEQEAREAVALMFEAFYSSVST